METDKYLHNMHFTIKKLGCIAQGDVTIKPLTLMCGANNSGKTWVMYAIYGFLCQILTKPIDPSLLGLDALDKKLHADGTAALDLRAWLPEYGTTLLNALHLEMKARLPDIFNGPEALFENSAFDWTGEQAQMLDSAIARAMNIDIDLGTQGKTFFKINKPAGESVVSMTLSDSALQESAEILIAGLVDHLMAKEEHKNVFLLPAERNGLHLFFRELREQRNARAHPKYRRANTLESLQAMAGSYYAEPVEHYIDYLNNLGKIEQLGVRALRKGANMLKHASLGKPDALSLLAGKINQVSGGKYAVDIDGNISFTPTREAGDAVVPPALDLHLTSSTVKSLFGLWHFIEHIAEPGDVLMIDEPELNLHPNNQRLVARILVQLVNAGLTVICSTHSDYIVREINSLLLLSRPHPKREALMEKFGIHDSEVIAPEHVAAYFYNEKSVEPMEIDPEDGIIAGTFDQVIQDLNVSGDAIYYAYRDEAETGSENDES